ncbi:tigger transposable element-derived protein 1 [Trichonephila clavipes]|nr:tigger transposable element-derived protein 1 [Trichonephila clavipes]
MADVKITSLQGDFPDKKVDHARQINLAVDTDDVQELLDSHNHGLRIDQRIEMHEHDIEEESLNPVQSEDRMAVRNWTEGLSLNEKGVTNFKNIDSNEERIFSTKQGIKNLSCCCEEILREKVKSLSQQRERLFC